MKISNDNPCYYLTSVTNTRIPIFQTDKLREITANAVDEARKSARFLIYAYVIMPDHYHLITDSSRKISEVLRYLNGITARRIIDYLKRNGLTSSLAKLRQETRKRRYKYSVWEHHSNSFSINNEKTLLQKVHYIHQNPVKAELVGDANEYEYSSARIWNRRPLEEEPLKIDADKIDWRVPPAR